MENLRGDLAKNMDEKQRLDHKLSDKARRAFNQLNEEWSYDMAPEYRIELNSEKMDMAHDALEQCLKRLILRTGKVSDIIREHGLQNVFRRLREFDTETANRLEAAYKAALDFYRVKPEVLPEIHGSLERYFDFAGSGELYTKRKYLSLEGYEKEYDLSYHEKRTNLVTAMIHAELLYACEWVLRGRESAINVNTRVEGIIGRYLLQPIGNDVERKRAIENWCACVNETGSFAEVLIKERSKGVSGNPIAQETCEWLLVQRFTEAKDWAIQYVLQRANTILQGSIKTELKPEISTPTETSPVLSVNSPSGVFLGNIIELWDGTYQTYPVHGGMNVFVEDKKTAIACLVQETSTQVMVDGRDVTAAITVVGQDHRKFISDMSNYVPSYPQFGSTESYKLQLWDGNHGFAAGESVMLRICKLDCAGIDLYLKGVVQQINEGEITVQGRDGFAECHKLGGQELV